jgi:hypothetical protein
MQENFSTTWADIGAQWPDPIQLRDADRKRLPGFPYSKGYIRNLTTGLTRRDPALADHVFYCGRYPQVRKQVLIDWLESRTRR